MPEKTAKNGSTYAIDGKHLTWTTDEGVKLEVPLRIKLKVIREMADADPNNVATMFAILEQIIPGEKDTLDEMDVNDFTAMFTTWNEEYAALSGAALGESSGSTA